MTRPSRDMTSTSPIDAYLAALSTRLTVDPEKRATILEELRNHLKEAAAAEEAQGATPAEAEAQAVAAFGSVAETARSFNATLPVYWDWRRMAQGVVFGALTIWIVWTLVTLPLLVQALAEHHFDTGASSMSPGDLLFFASPLSFGIFYALADGPWAGVLILVLFGAVAFVLGSRASSGWRAGLSFGLGVFVGLPFLFPAVVYNTRFVPPLLALPFIVPIWLLAPYAIFAAWLGERFARVNDRRRMRVATIPAPRSRSTPGVAIAGLLILVALLGVNGWSLVRSLTSAPAAPSPSVEQQLATAQAELPFTIRQPGYLPAGMALTSAFPAYSDCNPCVNYSAVILEYRDSHGGWITLTEESHQPPATPTSSAMLDFSISAGSSTEYRRMWWLGAEVRTEQQTTLAWNDGALDYTLSTNMQMPLPMLERIAPACHAEEHRTALMLRVVIYISFSRS